jgi:hypothetical protein
MAPRLPLLLRNCDLAAEDKRFLNLLQRRSLRVWQFGLTILNRSFRRLNDFRAESKLAAVAGAMASHRGSRKRDFATDVALVPRFS